MPCLQVALEAARAIIGPGKFDILGHRMGASVAIQVHIYRSMG